MIDRTFMRRGKGVNQPLKWLASFLIDADKAVILEWLANGKGGLIYGGQLFPLGARQEFFKNFATFWCLRRPDQIIGARVIA